MTDPVQLARSIVGGDIGVSVHTFSSGAISMDIRPADQSAVVSGHPGRREWGVSVGSSDEQAFAGYERVAATLDDALTAVREAFQAAGRRPAHLRQSQRVWGLRAVRIIAIALFAVNVVEAALPRAFPAWMRIEMATTALLVGRVRR